MQIKMHLHNLNPGINYCTLTASCNHGILRVQYSVILLELEIKMRFITPINYIKYLLI